MGNYNTIPGYDTIKQHLDPATVRQLLEELGYSFDRSGRFAIREERTPSASVDPRTGRITDFGGDFGGDIFDLLHAFHEMDKRQARQWVAERLGITADRGADTPTARPVRKKTPEEIERQKRREREEEARIIEEARREFDAMERVNLHNPHHLVELNAVAPFWLYSQATVQDRAMFLDMVRYDRFNATLVTACIDGNARDFRFIGYKWRRRTFSDGRISKWHARKGTHPNRHPFIRIQRNDGPIYIVEGHHDALTAILMGLDFVMIPTAAYQGETESIERETRGRPLRFIVEDEKAYRTMKPLAHALDDGKREITLRQFRRGEKCDLSQFVEGFNSLQEVALCL